jgi:hypothetical protein
MSIVLVESFWMAFLRRRFGPCYIIFILIQISDEWHWEIGMKKHFYSKYWNIKRVSLNDMFTMKMFFFCMNKQRKWWPLQGQCNIELLVDLNLFQSNSESRLCFLTLHKSTKTNFLSKLTTFFHNILEAAQFDHFCAESNWFHMITVAKSAILIN